MSKKYSKKIVGIDFSDQSIEIVEVGVFKGNTEILNKNRIEFDLGVVENGEIKDFEKFEKINKNLFQNIKNQKIEVHEILLGLPESQVFFTVEEIGKEPLNEEIVAGILQKNIPLNIDSVRYSYATTRITGENGEKEFVVILASRKEYLNSLLQFYAKLKIKIKLFDFSFLSTHRYVYNDINSASYMLVDLGSRYTTFAVFNKQCAVYSGRINIGGNLITKNISQNLKISLEEADSIKKKVNISLSENPEVSSIITASVEQIVEQIKKISKHIEEKFNLDIGEIIIAGGGSKIINIDEIFSYNLSEFKNKVFNISKIKNNETNVLYFGALGLVERELYKIWIKSQPIIATGQEKRLDTIKNRLRFKILKIDGEIKSRILKFLIIGFFGLMTYFVFGIFNQQKINTFHYRDSYVIDFSTVVSEENVAIVAYLQNYEVKKPEKIELVISSTREMAIRDLDEEKILVIPLELKDLSKIVFPLNIQWLYSEKNDVEEWLRKKIVEKYDNLDGLIINKIEFVDYDKENSKYRVETIVDFSADSEIIVKNSRENEKQNISESKQIETKQIKQYIEIVNIPQINNLNIRAFPEKGDNIIHKGKLGEKYELVSQIEKWNKILLEDGREAWVLKDYSKIVD